MFKFYTLNFPSWTNFVAGSKHSIHSMMVSIDRIMALKDHYRFKYVHINRISRQPKDKVFVFKMSMDHVGSGINMVKCMQCIGDIELHGSC